MESFEYEEYGIVYKRKIIEQNGDKSLFVLIPSKLVKGYSSVDNFYVDGKTTYGLAVSKKELLKKDILVGAVASPEALMDYYEAWEVDIEEISALYFLEESDYITFAYVDGEEVQFKKVKKNIIKELSDVQIARILEDDAAVTLSEKTLDYFIKCKDITTIKEGLIKLKGLIKETEDHLPKLNAMRLVYDKEGKLKTAEVGLANGISLEQRVEVETGTKVAPRVTSDISLLGLETYLKERVFGHDSEIEDISTILIMNSRAKEGDIIKSILIPGPTGSGKTLTFESACEYMNIPCVTVNSPNLVPQGIVGTSLEDVLYGIISKSGGDITKASKGLVFFDEFDKLGNNNSDQKESVIQIMLMFMSGADFSFEKDKKTYSINTKHISKMFAGAFNELFSSKKRPLGFGATSDEEKKFNKKLLYDYGHLDKQLIDRINYVIPYDGLSIEDRKRALLSSKASALLKEAERLKREFGIEISGYEEYADGVIEALERDAISTRDVNNVVLNSFLPIERTLLLNEGHVSRLTLTRETALEKKFNIE